jgi:transposase
MARRKHGAEFKREAVKLAKRAGVAQTQVARELGIHPNLLRNWIRQFDSGRWEASIGAELKTANTQEVEQLRRELNRVKMERDILKKALAYFAKEPS